MNDSKKHNGLCAWVLSAFIGGCIAGCVTVEAGDKNESYLDQVLKENIGDSGGVRTDGLDSLDADLGLDQQPIVAVTAPKAADDTPAVKAQPLIVKPATPARATVKRVKLMAPTPRNLKVSTGAAAVPARIITQSPAASAPDAMMNNDDDIATVRGKAPSEAMLLGSPSDNIESNTPFFDLPDLPATDLLAQPNKEGVGAGDRGVMIQPDSILWISVEEDPSLNGKYLVNEYSAIDFGYVGLVLLNDMNIDSAALKLKGVLESRYLKKASVGVKLAKASYDRVGVGGAVLNPGMLKIGPGSTISLNDALRRAGGLRLDSTDARVKFIKNGLLSPFGPIAEGTIYPLSDDNGKPMIPRIDLSNSDLVYVYPHRADAISAGGKRILLLGEVSRPGFVQFSGGEPCTLMNLIFKIGGFTRFAKTSAIRIIRRDKNGRETEIQADAKILIREGNPEDDMPLEDGDRIIVPTRGIQFF